MTRRPPLIRGNLRPDLRGVVLDLDDTSCRELRTGETATLRVGEVRDAVDTDDVLVTGLWSGPDGVHPDAEVLVRATALPVYKKQRS